MSSSELVDIVYIMAFCLGGMSFALGPFVIVFFLAPVSRATLLAKPGRLLNAALTPLATLGSSLARYTTCIRCCFSPLRWTFSFCFLLPSSTTRLPPSAIF